MQKSQFLQFHISFLSIFTQNMAISFPLQNSYFSHFDNNIFLFRFFTKKKKLSFDICEKFNRCTQKDKKRGKIFIQ